MSSAPDPLPPTPSAADDLRPIAWNLRWGAIGIWLLGLCLMGAYLIFSIVRPANYDAEVSWVMSSLMMFAALFLVMIGGALIGGARKLRRLIDAAGTEQPSPAKFVESI